jgi:hypothetical protein
MKNDAFVQRSVAGVAVRSCGLGGITIPLEARNPAGILIVEIIDMGLTARKMM